MQTIYIDVYFLINFTVDLLAIYSALSMLKIHSNEIRIILSSLVGSLYAVLGILFIENNVIMYLISPIILFFIVLICAKEIGIYRKIKFAVAFMLFEIIIGGFVYYAFCLLNELLGNLDVQTSAGENRGLLILSLLILLTIGALKLFAAFFGKTRSEKSVKICVMYKENSCEFEAFVDSGNLAVDPIDKTPVMLVSPKLYEKIFGKYGEEIRDIYKLPPELKKKVRIIPVSFGNDKRILYGIKAESVFVINKNRREKIKVVIALNSDEKNYGGFPALIPLLALEDAIYENS